MCRAGRLTDGPYTSYDLNTLLQATAGERRAVVIDQGTECFHIVAIISIDFLYSAIRIRIQSNHSILKQLSNYRATDVVQVW